MRSTSLRVFLQMILVVGIALISAQREAIAERCHPSENDGPYVIGKCGDRALPRSRTRRWSNIQLHCGSNSSHYIRRPFPVPMDLYEKWADLDWRAEQNQGKLGTYTEIREQMQELRQKNEPEIKWNGQIPYQTVESWNWVECHDGPDESACGSHYETRQESYTDYVTDKKGNTRAVQKTRSVQVKVIHSCYHDESRSESRDCSTEIMSFDARFRRPNPKTEWGPRVANSGYYDILPSQYDLLPGEMEDIQIYNTAGGIFSGDTTMSPKTEVGNKWNEYRVDMQPSSFACVFHSNYHMNVVVSTLHRIKRAPPNAFGFPVDDYGQVTDPLHWITRAGEKRAADGNLEELRVKPAWLNLSDKSSVYIADLSRQTRRHSAVIEKARDKLGKNSNAKASDVANFLTAQPKSKGAENKGFMKDTRMKIDLYEFPVGEFKIHKAHTVFRSGSDAINGRSPDKNDQYQVELSSSSTDRDLYRSSAPLGLTFISEQFAVNLRPGREYEIRVAMSQKGIPFYDETKWSEPLSLKFQIDSNKKVDDRSFLEKSRNWLGDSWWKKPYTFVGGLF